MAKQLLAPDGTPIKFNGKDVWGFDYIGVVKQVDVARRTMAMIGTDESKDRDGDIIRMNGWDLENYRKNPVFLWAHNYGSVPIARATKVTKKREPEPHMLWNLMYPTKGIYSFADMILELYGEQMINASSVGFIPNKWNEIEAEQYEEGTRRTWGREYIKQELLELSGCAVPSNPNALQNALKGKSFGFKLDDITKWLTGALLIPRPGKEADVLEEMDGEPEIVDETAPVSVQVPVSYNVEGKENPPKEPPKEQGTQECSKWGDLEGLEVPPFEKEFEITKEDILKPYPNEHACRLEDPGKYERFARKNCFKKHDDKCIDFIFGYPKEGGGELQAMRYGKEIWTPAAAKSHCKSHDGTFEAAAPKEGELEEQKVTVEDIDKRLKSLEEKFEGVSRTIESIAEQLKAVPKASQTKVNDISQVGTDEEGKVESAMERILGEAFQSKTVLTSPSKSSVNKESVTNLVKAIQDLKMVLETAKKL